MRGFLYGGMLPKKKKKRNHLVVVDIVVEARWWILCIAADRRRISEGNVIYSRILILIISVRSTDDVFTDNAGD